MARQRFVFDKKLKKVVPLVVEEQKPRKLSKKEIAKQNRNKRELRALCRAKCVTIVDEGSGKLVNVARVARRTRAKWPIISDAMAVDPRNINKARAILQQAGVNTEFTPTGEPILRSAAHRKEHAQAMGFYDRNGGYGDPAPKHFTG